MAKAQKRYRTEAAFSALRLGHAPGSFDEFLDKLKKEERREDKAVHAAASKRAKLARKRYLRTVKREAEAARRKRARKEWNAKRDAVHLAFLEQGLDPVGVGGVVTDRDVARIVHVYGEKEGKLLRGLGEGHRRGYVLTLDDLALVRMRPDQVEGGKTIAGRCREYGETPVYGALNRLVKRGYLRKDGTGRRCHPLKPYEEGVVFSMTEEGRARRNWLIERLGELMEPVDCVVKGFRG